MILRAFTVDDLPVISRYQYRDTSVEEIKKMILQWDTRQYCGRYFEMLAIEKNGCVVGYVSVMEQSDSSVSEGVEIYAPYRRQGLAYNAVTLLLEHIKLLGYSSVFAQVRQDNAASIALHHKLGFQITDSFSNPKGNLVYEFSIEL